MQKMYKDFEMHGVSNRSLNSKTYEAVRHRLQVEEATASVTHGNLALTNGSTEDEDDDEED